MKIKYFIGFFIISFVIISSVVLADRVFAQEGAGETNIQYPIEELGSCTDKADCKAYCDKSENTEACVVYAEKNNLMSGEELKTAKNFIKAGAKGPGGCKGKESCEEYCNDMSRIDECVAYAEKNNLLPEDQLAEAKKVQEAIKRGVKPPPCGNKKQCDVYCNEADHLEECINFGVEAGFIQGKELEDSQKMLAAIKRGIKPPPCKGKEACDEYCNSPDNMEVCMNFAMEAGFMGEQEKADSQKMLQALKKGIKPPPCKGKEACDEYCAEESHFEECMSFAEAAGFMSAEDAAMARKTGGKGPGGCKGKEECEAFCNNPDNQKTCFNFAKDNGMISETDLRQMEEGSQKFEETLNQAPLPVLDCLNSQFGADMIEKFKSGEAMPPKEIGDKMRECFEKGMGPMGPEGQGNGTMPEGPGGCKSPEECKIYCESSPEKCQNFQPGPGEINPGGQMMPQQAGPGGCKGPEECKVYCESNPDQCKNFGPTSGGQSAPSPDNNQGMPNNYQNQQEQVPPMNSINCQNPEECQNMMQNQSQMPPQGTCQGESCQYGPPPGQSGGMPQIQIPEGSFQPPPGQQQPINNMPNPNPPPSSSIVPKSLLGSLLNLFLSIFK